MTTASATTDAHTPLPRLRTISQLWRFAALLASLGVAALAVDVPLAGWVHWGNCPRIINKLCGLSETFSHAVGVALIVVIIAVLDPRHRRVIPRIAAASLGSGLIANVFKLLLARVRPHHFDFESAGHGLDAFGEWFPLFDNPSWQQGFPSSHAATAAGLAIVLSRYYPRGHWLFPTIAVLAGFQRVADQSHFLSDVFWGATIGCVFAPLCVYGGRLSRHFDRLETWLATRSEAGVDGGVDGIAERAATTSAARQDAGIPRAA